MQYIHLFQSTDKDHLYTEGKVAEYKLVHVQRVTSTE
jgi:hypothetical protein